MAIQTRSSLLAAAIATVALTLAGCAGSTASPAASSTTPAGSTATTTSLAATSNAADTGATTGKSAENELDGRLFISTGATDDHQLVGNSTVMMTFSGNQISVIAGCNTLFGGATVTDGVLDAPTLASSMMACSAELTAQDQWLSEFLSSKPTVAVDGQTLTLKSGADQLTLKAAPTDNSTELDGRSFVSTGAAGDHPLVAGSTVTIRFAAAQLSANAGCNTLAGGVTLTGGVVAAGTLASTLIGCADDLAKQDSWLSEFLTSKPTWTLSGDTLTLKNPTDQLTLKSAPPDSAVTAPTSS